VDAAPEALRGFSCLADLIAQVAGEPAAEHPELVEVIRGGEATLGQHRAHAALEWENDIALNLKGLRQARETGDAVMIDAFEKVLVHGVKQVLALAGEARAEATASSETDAARQARLERVRRVAADEGVRDAEPLSQVAMRAIRRRHRARAERPQTPARSRAPRIRANRRVIGSRRSTAAGGGSPGTPDDDDADPPSAPPRSAWRDFREYLVQQHVDEGAFDARASHLIDLATTYIEQGGMK
jgi:hypothetical protein